jgi:predicted 2-oxoglutarate/Fe(II)-dependent dioxygenase YbiX
MRNDYKLEAADPSNIVIIENFISSKDLDAVYEYCYSINEWISQSYSNTDKISTGATMKKNAPEVYDKMFSYLTKVQEAVEYKFGRKLEPSIPGIRRWDAGESQGPHADGETVHGEATDTYIVDYGSIMYLNDNYDGGELYFPAYDIDFKPKAGTLAFFPSSTYYVHGVKEVLGGVRYTSAHFWVPVKHNRLIEMTKNNEQPVYS